MINLRTDRYSNCLIETVIVYILGIPIVWTDQIGYCCLYIIYLVYNFMISEIYIDLFPQKTVHHSPNLFGAPQQSVAVSQVSPSKTARTSWRQRAAHPTASEASEASDSGWGRRWWPQGLWQLEMWCLGDIWCTPIKCGWEILHKWRCLAGKMIRTS